MGSFDVKPIQTPQERKVLMDALINDLDALDLMIKEGIIESSIQRIGAEQEICFVDKDLQPAPINSEVLSSINDKRFTYEHAVFNAEINPDPLEFTGDCLSKLESNLTQDLERLVATSKDFDADIVLVGILPTIEREHLTSDYFSSLDRYRELNRLLTEIRGEPYEFRIEGTDELITRHNTTMFESCTTSFQVHLQVSAEDICRRYNWAQAIAGPVLAASTNSPLLLGKRLWRETRIALFHQAIDSRKPTFSVTEKAPRVTFGEDWVQNSILEIYKDDIVRYPFLFHRETTENSLKDVKAGKVPRLDALTTHNGTVYRWNRACYGITNNKPHLRIECRHIPSGPTVVDEIANAAFWLGLMNGQPKDYFNIQDLIGFHDVKSNFYKAARMGLGAQFNWIDHKRIPAKELILNELLPMANEGLKKAGINKEDIDKYLGIIEARVTSEKTGSQWILDAFNQLKEFETPASASLTLTSQMIKNQKKNIPIHQWLIPTNWKELLPKKGLKVSQVMSRDLFTARENDPVKLVIKMMVWKNVRHIPVEDEIGKLKGLLTTTRLLEYAHDPKDLTISDIMIMEPIVINPEARIDEAIDLLTEHKIGGLPVVRDGYLVGMITERDFIRLTKTMSEFKK